MITADVLTSFARLDTSKQVTVLKRVGIDTEAADKVLGHLAGMYPERYDILLAHLHRQGI